MKQDQTDSDKEGPVSEKEEESVKKNEQDSQDIDPMDATFDAQKKARRQSRQLKPVDRIGPENDEEFEQKLKDFVSQLEFDFSEYRTQKRVKYLESKGIKKDDLEQMIDYEELDK